MMLSYNTLMANRTKIVSTAWTHNFAYAVGLIASDGNLSPDLRHINITSKDREMLVMMKDILKLENKIGRKARGGSKMKKYYVLQFGSKNFFEFLLSIGLTPAKSKTMNALLIPDLYFLDFFRGCMDGDGNINEFQHPESAQIQLRIGLSSASKEFLLWVHKKIRTLNTVRGGWIDKRPYKSVYTLRFGKQDSIKIMQAMYHSKARYFLKRKHKTATTYL